MYTPGDMYDINTNAACTWIVIVACKGYCRSLAKILSHQVMFFLMSSSFYYYEEFYSFQLMYINESLHAKIDRELHNVKAPIAVILYS